MAHELTVNKISGKVEMFYVGEAPWHALGQYKAAPATSQEAIQLAGMDWLVDLQPLYLHRDGKAYPVDSHRAVVRTDTHEQLGVVGEDYHPTQNRELFEFADALVGQSAAMYHTAGTIRGGSRVWILAKLPTNLVVVPGDVLEQYLMIGSSHDGSMANTAGFTTTRVVCSNTFHAAIPGLKNMIKIRHMRNVAERLEDARATLKIGVKYFEALGRKLQTLTTVTLNEMTARKYFEAVFPLTKNGKGEDSTRIKNTHETLAFLFSEGRGNQLPGVKNTLWAALNAVTEYTDHVRGVKKDGVVRDSWAEAALFGSGLHVKQRAFDVALEVAATAGK